MILLIEYIQLCLPFIYIPCIDFHLPLALCFAYVKVYQEKGVADKERYQSELKAFKDGLKLGQQTEAELAENAA